MLKNYFTYLHNLLHKIIVARDWAMRYGTNLAQLINISFAIIFTYVFGFAERAIANKEIYSAFLPFTESSWWLVMPAIVILQITFMAVKSVRCDVLSGFTLLLSVPVWTFVSIKFANAGFVNTGTYIYAVWAFTCFLSGWRMMDLYDYKLILKRRGKHAANTGNGAKCSNLTAIPCSNDRRSSGCLHDSDTKGES